MGAVVVWSPENQSLVKELGFYQCFDVSSPENLAQFLNPETARASSPPPPTPRKDPKVGENDSKDPKKIP